MNEPQYTNMNVKETVNVVESDKLINCFKQEVKVGSIVMYIPRNGWGVVRIGRLVSVNTTEYIDAYPEDYRYSWLRGKTQKYEVKKVVIQGVSRSSKMKLDEAGKFLGWEDGQLYFYKREIGGDSVFNLLGEFADSLPAENKCGPDKAKLAKLLEEVK